MLKMFYIFKSISFQNFTFDNLFKILPIFDKESKRLRISDILAKFAIDHDYTFSSLRKVSLVSLKKGVLKRI